MDRRNTKKTKTKTKSQFLKIKKKCLFFSSSSIRCWLIAKLKHEIDIRTDDMLEFYNETRSNANQTRSS